MTVLVILAQWGLVRSYLPIAHRDYFVGAGNGQCLLHVSQTA